MVLRPRSSECVEHYSIRHETDTATATWNKSHHCSKLGVVESLVAEEQGNLRWNLIDQTVNWSFGKERNGETLTRHSGSSVTLAETWANGKTKAVKVCFTFRGLWLDLNWLGCCFRGGKGRHSPHFTVSGGKCQWVCVVPINNVNYRTVTLKSLVYYYWAAASMLFLLCPLVAHIVNCC